ncbi:acyl-CoA dehydrogenase family protein [Kibdelosporangium persicum]|uniref:Butyryl-CoA dehydrogenase n=1 Tax=Kibdelosporangium persicum TaxID=2698649 RepID=A0ABX2F770_9PSEU|nr:acyl-CoA dehydrogenase family protein [Kibdelosporangium persicum]NRN67038.1 Butyryl-CoA dehydrogenase [Kibdelosporangium persicum]
MPAPAAEWYARMSELGDKLGTTVTEEDRTAEFSFGKWNLIAETGLFGLPFAQDRRRSDETLPQITAALEGLGHGSDDASLGFSVATQLASCAVPLARFGSPALRERYEHAVSAGRLIGAHAITEPEAGSDALAMSTCAAFTGDDYVLNGHKAFISNGPIADLIVVYALTGVPGTFTGLTAFIVPRDTDGLTLSEPLDKMGLRCSPLGTADLVGVRVPADHVVGQVGGGSWLLSHVMAREILFIAAGQVGQMQRRLDACTGRARGRVQFGQPIGAFQAVSHKIVDMRISVETARYWLYDTTTRMVAGEDVTARVAMTKIVVSEANVATARTAVQVFGGAGYLSETGIERGLRDAIAGTIYSGTSEIQRNKVAAVMGLGENGGQSW